MVLVEEKTAYFQKFEEGDRLFLFVEYLQNKNVDPPNDNSEVAHKLLYALSNGVETVTNLINDQSEKKPNVHSPYIYKDLDLFLYICVAKKFNLNDEWIRTFLSMRRTEDHEANCLTKSFENLLNNNLDSSDGFSEIILVFKYILDYDLIDENRLNETYYKLSKKSFPFYSKPFLNIVAIKAIDIIILYKGLKDYEESKALKNFKLKFDKKSKQISIGAFWVSFTTCLMLSLLVGYKYFFGSVDESEMAGKVLTYISPLALLTCLGLLRSRDSIVSFFQISIKRFFGG